MPEPALTIASLIRDSHLQEACSRWLQDGSGRLVLLDPELDPLVALERSRDAFDVLLLEQGALVPGIYQSLKEQGLVLPAVVIGEVSGQMEFHEAEVHLPPDQLEQLRYSLDAAISRFLRRGLVRAGSSLEDAPDTTTDTSTDNASSNASAGASAGATQAGSGGLPPERWKLTNRLKGRLGLLGVFYKRDPSRFLRNLSEREREELLHSLERTYRDLLLSYFRDPAAANQALESFVNTAFFSDLPITKAVEIHMNLIDGFSKQLKLEGHTSDFLQDYRLALLDVMAHLCEMYRRSVPPDAPLVDAPLVAPPGP